jgi:glyoxylate utilization-related uncharacterized protein
MGDVNDPRSSRRSLNSTLAWRPRGTGIQVKKIIYVLEGAPLESEVGGKPPVTLKPGDVLFIPAGAVHAAKNVGKRKGAELATHIVEKGKPLLTKVGGRFPR